MNIKDRLVRQNIEDKIEIGDIVRRVYNGKFGEVLRAYINGIITRELTDNQTNPKDRMPMTPDRILGRCEAYTNVLLDMERMINESDELQQIKRKKSGEEEEDDL